MTLWHVQKLYRDNVPGYVVLPYDFRGNIKIVEIVTKPQ